MKKIQSKIKDIINNNIVDICPLESIILYYMIQTITEGIFSDITINELYNIIDIYNNSFTYDCIGHKTCLCKKYFTKNNQCTLCTNTNISMNKYLMTHYEHINNIGKVYDEFLKVYPKVNWLINHTVFYNGNNLDYKITKNMQLIGYDENNVYIIYIKPQFNDMNYNNILIDSIYDTFIIKNIKPIELDTENITKKNKEDYNRFSNKKVNTIVFSLDNDTYTEFSWGNNNELITDVDNNIFLKNNIKEVLINKFHTYNNYILYFYKYYKNEYLLNNNNIISRNIIKYIINKYKTIKDEYNIKPHYILKFFERIETEIDMDKKQLFNILNKYDNDDMFISCLNNIIENSINEYLEIE